MVFFTEVILYLPVTSPIQFVYINPVNRFGIFFFKTKSQPMNTVFKKNTQKSANMQISQNQNQDKLPHVGRLNFCYGHYGIQLKIANFFRAYSSSLEAQSSRESLDSCSFMESSEFGLLVQKFQIQEVCEVTILVITPSRVCLDASSHFLACSSAIRLIYHCQSDLSVQFQQATTMT